MKGTKGLLRYTIRLESVTASPSRPRRPENAFSDHAVDEVGYPYGDPSDQGVQNHRLVFADSHQHDISGQIKTSALQGFDRRDDVRLFLEQQDHGGRTLQEGGRSNDHRLGP